MWRGLDTEFSKSAELVLGFYTQISQPAGLHAQEITNSNILLLIYGHRQKAEHTESER